MEEAQVRAAGRGAATAGVQAQGLRGEPALLGAQLASEGVPRRRAQPWAVCSAPSARNCTSPARTPLILCSTWAMPPPSRRAATAATDSAVGKIWSKSEAGRQGTKMKLTVSAQGIRMVHAEAARCGVLGHLYLLHRVTYCVADGDRPRSSPGCTSARARYRWAVMLRCHAGYSCRSPRRRRPWPCCSALLRRATMLWRNLNGSSGGTHARHQQQELAGAHTIPQCCCVRCSSCTDPAKPLVERSRSAPARLHHRGPARQQQEQELQEEEEEEHAALPRGGGPSWEESRQSQRLKRRRWWWPCTSNAGTCWTRWRVATRGAREVRLAGP